MHGDLRLKLGEEALDDDALEELDVARLVVGEPVNRPAGDCKEILEVLLALLEQLQSGFVR